MKLIRCKKCGTVVSSSDTYLEQMILAMNECNRKALTGPKYDRNSYVQQAIQIRKMITHVQHLTYTMEERKATVLSELSEIVHYLRVNNLITDEKLNELRDIARHRAALKNKQEEEAIDKLYGNFENLFVNRTRSDTTANKAISRYKEANS